jgi:hypothetical protein
MAMSLIDVTPMTNREHKHEDFSIFDFANKSIIPDAIPPQSRMSSL